MSLPRGSTLRLSPLRRLMVTLLSFSRAVPMVAIERRIQLEPLVSARRRLAEKPSWFALFLKAYAIIARETPALRQSFLTFPWQRLHQHACNVASVTVVREHDGEDAVFLSLIRHPETLSLRQLDTHLNKVRTQPVETIPDFRRMVLHGRLPGWIRQFVWWLGLRCIGDWRAKFGGTFGLTGIAALGATSLHTLSPLTSTLTFGVLEDDGSMMLRLFYDHRVMDGVLPARVLAMVEHCLLSLIKNEMNEQYKACIASNRVAMAMNR